MSWKPIRKDLDYEIKLFHESQARRDFYFCQIRAQGIRRLQNELGLQVMALPDPTTCRHDVLDLVASNSYPEGDPCFACTRCWAHGFGAGPNHPSAFLLGKLQDLAHEVRCLKDRDP